MENQHASKSLLIVGQSLESVVTAVVMASLGNQVILSFWAENFEDFQDLRHFWQQNHYFEQPLMALWDLYVGRGQICLYQGAASLADLLGDFSVQNGVKGETHKALEAIWLMLDDDGWLSPVDKVSDHLVESAKILPEVCLSDADILAITALRCPVVLSGILPLGLMQTLADRLKTPQVLYVPFVFLRKNDSYNAMLKPSLLLIGEKVAQIHQHFGFLLPLLSRAEQVAITDICTAEFVRSGIMTLLATRLSFINEMSSLAQLYGIDMGEVSQLMGRDDRIGREYLNAGSGFGGRSLPLELQALKDSFASHQIKNHLIKSVDRINQTQKEWLFRQFWQYFEGFIEGKSVLIWGGAYKAESGNTQNAAIHQLLPLFWAYQVKTYVCAFAANAELAQHYASAITDQNLHLVNDPYTDLDRVDALLILNWSGYQAPDIQRLNQTPIPIFDGVNLLKFSQTANLVADYQGVGRQHKKD